LSSASAVIKLYSTVETVDYTRRCSSHWYQSQILVENRDFCPSYGVPVGILP